MDNMGISTEPSFLEVELPPTLLESPSTSTFLPDEEASICPLLSNNSTLGPALISHPLSPNIITCDITSSNIDNTDCKAETSSSGSSTGIAMDDTSTNLFNQVNYHHLQNNNMVLNQDASSHCLKRRKAKETPVFVSWNWPIIRKCSLLVFIAGVLGMFSIAVSKIVSMPKYCNPEAAWYRGSVFYEINPVTFQDTDNNGIGDIGGVKHGIEYLTNLGVTGVRLNSIFPDFPPHERYVNASSIKTIRPELGNSSDIQNLAKALHSHNMTLLLDLPLEHLIAGKNEVDIMNLVGESLIQWRDHGVNGFYIKGLGSLMKDISLLKCLSSWKRILGKNRVLIVEEAVVKDKSQADLSLLLPHIDLIDVVLNIENNTQHMKERMQKILKKLPVGDDTTFVHWSIQKNNSAAQTFSSKKIYAATIMQLILPGTPNIVHEHMKAIAQNNGYNNTDQLKQVWADDIFNVTDEHNKLSHHLDLVKGMITLRTHSPSMYKNFICKANSNRPNTQIITHRNVDILMVVRNYPRKNSIVSVTNFGSTEAVLDLTSKFYSGNRMLVIGSNEKIYFKELRIDAFDTYVVKLDK